MNIFHKPNKIANGKNHPFMKNQPPIFNSTNVESEQHKLWALFDSLLSLSNGTEGKEHCHFLVL